MREDFTLSWRSAVIAGAVLITFFGSVILLDYRFGGFEKSPLFPIERLIRGSSVESDLPLEEIQARLGRQFTDPKIMPGRMGAVSFELNGCIATYRIDHTRMNCESGASSWKTEKFYDLRLLKTSPWSVEVNRVRDSRLVGDARIRWKFREEAAERLGALHRESRRMLEEERARHGTDVRARRVALKARYQTELQDRLFETNGERVFYCDGQEILFPEWTRNVYHLVRAEDVETVVDLMHAYASRACPFDPIAFE